MRRDVLEEGKADACEFLRRLRLDALGLEFLGDYELPFTLIIAGAIVGARGADTHLDAKVVIDPERPLEEEEVLRQVRELPHAAKLLQHTGLLHRLLRLHLISSSFAGDHGDASCPWATRRERRVMRVGSGVMMKLEG